MLHVKLNLQQSHFQETRKTLTSFVNQFWVLFTIQGSTGWAWHSPDLLSALLEVLCTCPSLAGSVNVRVSRWALELNCLFLSLYVLVILVWNYNAAEFPEIWYIGVFSGQQNNWSSLEWLKEMAFKSGVLNRRGKREETLDAKTL